MSGVRRVNVEIHWRTDSNAVLHEHVTPTGKYVAASDYDAIAARLADAELSLTVFDAGRNSEYWLRHPDASAGAAP
jgi:hypothetical protein